MSERPNIVSRKALNDALARAEAAEAKLDRVIRDRSATNRRIRRYREALERAQDTFHWIQFDAASFMAASQAASKAEADARAALEGDKDE